MTEPADEAAARSLLSAAAVRERAHAMLALAEADGLDHFRVHMDRLPAAADHVLQVMRRAYPTLDIPFHARWRHFEAGGFDRWSAYAEAVGFEDVGAMGRAAYDLAIVSVLLDAGAGPSWRYADTVTSETYTRSEGLAVASFNMLTSGLFSADPRTPFRADASALAALTVAELGDGLQVDDVNPMIGLEGRSALLVRLGRVALANPQVFGRTEAPRPGGLFDILLAEAEAAGMTLPAPRILDLLLATLGAIWPGRTKLGGVDLGDSWRHPALRRDDATSGIVPFHKLSQWLAYSLIEPLEWAGVAVTDVDGLTGLAEYRNGGLFLDLGVIALKDPAAVAVPHRVDEPLVVEWRALTVALLDRIADEIRGLLGRDRESLPLAKVLEGGTWAAGRDVAARLRPGGGPPLTIVSDGTVF